MRVRAELGVCARELVADRGLARQPYRQRSDSLAVPERNGATIRVSNGSSFAMIGVTISLTVKTAYFLPAAIRILGGPQLYDDGVPADQSRSTFLFDSLHTRISAGPGGVSSTLVTFNTPPARLSAAHLTANYSATLWHAASTGTFATYGSYV
jgi:hypothetical protein